MKAEGKPSPEELKLLENLRGKVPEEVFGEPWSRPKAMAPAGSQCLASCLAASRGRRLPSADRITCCAAGWHEAGSEFLEFDSPQPPHRIDHQNLRLLGIEGGIRVVDPSQFQKRQQEFDFDIVSARFVMSMAPGESLRTLFGLAGCKNERLPQPRGYR